MPENFEDYLARVHVNPRNVIEAAAVFDRREDGPACCCDEQGDGPSDDLLAAQSLANALAGGAAGSPYIGDINPTAGGTSPQANTGPWYDLIKDFAPKTDRRYERLFVGRPPVGVPPSGTNDGTLDRFEPVYVTDETAEAITYVNKGFKNLAARIEVYSLPSREQSLALTALEEASHWANRAVAKAAVQPKVRTEDAG